MASLTVGTGWGYGGGWVGGSVGPFTSQYRPLPNRSATHFCWSPLRYRRLQEDLSVGQGACLSGKSA